MRKLFLGSVCLSYLLIAALKGYMATDIHINSTGPKTFWGEIAPCQHIVQLYEDDGVFLDTLWGFVGGGLRVGDGVIVIATAELVKALEARLSSFLDLRLRKSQDQYIPLEAEPTLSRFMRNGWPDEELFGELVSDLLTRARGDGRHVRAFGEMVALLWARGEQGATVRLEHLWHQFCQAQSFSLLCSYPRAGFTKDASASLRAICQAHSSLLA